MKILISDNRPVKQLQEQFNEEFPYLKLEFFTRPKKTGESRPRKTIRTQEQTIGECRTVHHKGHMNIIAAMTVAELEKLFREYYGLYVQVFRKSGKVWLETTVTDGWTLEQQNKQGETLTILVAAGRPQSPMG